MEGPSVQERALLAAVLEKALAKQNLKVLMSNAFLRDVYEDMQQTLRRLEDDSEVSESTATRFNIRSAKIIDLCRTLHATAVKSVDKPRLCSQLRQYLGAREDECTCPSKPELLKASTVQDVPFLKDFRDPYGGLKLIKWFLEHCSTNWRTKGCQYAPSCAIVQSSGSGKSRLMVQVARSVPMFYVCSRHPGDTGYPPRTPLIVEYLLFEGYAASDDKVYSRCAAFFCVASLYARAMWVWLQQYASFETACKQFRDKSEAVEQLLSGFLDSQLAEAFWKGFICKMKAIEEAIYAEVRKIGGKQSDGNRWQLVEDQAHGVTAEHLHSDVLKNEGLSFVVCLDEAGNLGPRRGKSHPFDLLTQLHRASRLMSEKLGGVLVMLDTLCSVPAFGQRENFPSSRMRQFGVESRVFTNLLTYNLWPYTPRPIHQIVKLESLAEHGRPLWMACRSAHPARSSAVLDLAAAKITGQIQLSGADIFEGSEQLGVALLAARVHLQIVSHTKLSEELVGYFMAHLNDIDGVGNSHVGYPSDPILALGAAKVLTSKYQYLRSLDSLALFLRAEYVQAGFRGELVVQLLMLRAFDQLAFKAGVYQERPVQAREFLGKLLGTGYKTLQDLKLTTKHNEEVLEGFMHLNHFVQVSYLPNRADLSEFLSRGAGIICNRGQEAIDLIIPVLLQKEFREGDPARTKTVGPCNTEKIRYRKRKASGTDLGSASPTLVRAAAEISEDLKALGPPKATFVSQDHIAREPGYIEPGSGEGGEEGLVQGKAKAGLASPSGDVPNAHRMSYIIVQCKNWMAEYYRAHPVVEVVSPLEEALEASGERKDEESDDENEDGRERSSRDKKTKNTKHKTPKKTKTKNTGKKKSAGTIRPYIFIGAYFTRFGKPEIYKLKYAQPPPPNCLPFAFLNGHLLIKDGSEGNALAEKIGALLGEFSDPANLREEDSEWNMVQNHPRYGTEIDETRLGLTLDAAGMDHGEEDEPESTAAQNDPRRVAAAILQSLERRQHAGDMQSAEREYGPSESGTIPSTLTSASTSTVRRSGRLAKRQS